MKNFPLNRCQPILMLRLSWMFRISVLPLHIFAENYQRGANLTPNASLSSFRTYPRKRRRTCRRSSVPCWTWPSTPSSSTSTPAATASRRRSWTSRLSCRACVTRCLSTPRPPTPSSRRLSPRRPARVGGCLDRHWAQRGGLFFYTGSLSSATMAHAQIARSPTWL